jgi:hypothetical protein
MKLDSFYPLPKEEGMSKEKSQRRDERKKPTMSLKERRQKKHDKKAHKQEHHFESPGSFESYENPQ